MTTMQFEKSDATELFHIIRSRGHSATRSKLLEVLFLLDQPLAERINREDEHWMDSDTVPIPNFD